MSGLQKRLLQVPGPEKEQQAEAGQKEGGRPRSERRPAPRRNRLLIVRS